LRESLGVTRAAFGLQEKIGKVIIPTEPSPRSATARSTRFERAFLPGYVLVEMDLNDDVWHVGESTHA